MAGARLGVLFGSAGGRYPRVRFPGAFAPTSRRTFDEVLEVVGGVLVAHPCTRRAGLLTLVPILVNTVAFQILIVGKGSPA